ncbi:oligomeric, coiled-coil, peripheral membrane protein, partial [Cryomyces antarcticus]
MEDTEAVVTDLTQAVTDLDRPTKKQVKRAKNFRNGSIHEAAFGTTSLKVRGDDEYKVLQDAYAKLEDELRGQKSRVRKLEDLVHRESNAGRVSAGNMFQMQRTQGRELTAPDPNAAIASPRLVDNLSRHSSVSSRRHSVNQGDEEKKLARRVVKLEAELAVEKDRGAGLEKEVAAKKNAENDANRQIEEANSTKNDLMENMEAQQKEFASERRTLEQDLQQ